MATVLSIGERKKGFRAVDSIMDGYGLCTRGLKRNPLYIFIDVQAHSMDKTIFAQ